MVCESPDDVYLSRCISLSTMQLYSTCNSPKRKSQAWSPQGSNNGFDFQFMCTKIAGESQEEVGVMSFADEIFSNGQVMPLKPPPRLAAKCSADGLHRCSSSGLKHTIQRMWTNDSDPFQKAAQKVRSRRSRSVSPHQWTIDDLNATEDFNQYKDNQDNQESDLADPRIINRVAEPRGLVIARKLRPLSMDQGKDKPLSPVKEKKLRVKGALSRSVRIGRESSCKSMLSKQILEFKSSRKLTANGMKNESGEREIKTVVKSKYQPKRMLCMGFHKDF